MVLSIIYPGVGSEGPLSGQERSNVYTDGFDLLAATIAELFSPQICHRLKRPERMADFLRVLEGRDFVGLVGGYFRTSLKCFYKPARLLEGYEYNGLEA